MKALVASVAFSLVGCATANQPQVAPPALDSRGGTKVEQVVDPTTDVLRFLDAVAAGRFDEVHARLAAPLRQRYSVERLEADYVAEPLAGERVARARRALAHTPWVVDGAVARLPLGDGHHLTAVLEDGAWKVAALEE
jgi:hypothetical protein